MVRAAWRQGTTVEYKGPVDLVTATDRAVEAHVVAGLRRHFPHDLIIAEEGAGDRLHRPESARRTWYLDPLDGTVNFAHGLPHFAVSLAVAHGTEVEWGLVYDPIREETFEACRGAGATLNGVRITVSPTPRLDEALLATGFPYDRRERLGFYLPFLGDMLARARDVRRIGSAALDLCYVACGRFDGFWEWKLRPWDTAAGALVLTEAGGRVTDFRGAPFDMFGDQVLATNGRVHEAMVRILVARLGPAA